MRALAAVGALVRAFQATGADCDEASCLLRTSTSRRARAGTRRTRQWCCSIRALVRALVTDDLVPLDLGAVDPVDFLFLLGAREALGWETEIQEHDMRFELVRDLESVQSFTCGADLVPELLQEGAQHPVRVFVVVDDEDATLHGSAVKQRRGRLQSDCTDAARKPTSAPSWDRERWLPRPRSTWCDPVCPSGKANRYSPAGQFAFVESPELLRKDLEP